MQPNAGLLKENCHLVNLVHALVGAITPNFRCVTFTCSDDEVAIYFLLEREDSCDREEIDDVIAEFEALQLGGIDVSFGIVVSQDPRWEVLESRLPGRMVFARKEDEEC